jgi:hypothetical protein
LERAKKAVSLSLVHVVVHGQHRGGQFRVGLDKGLQRFTHHGRGQRRHARNVHRQIHYREGLKVAHPVADADRLVTHTFQIRVDLDDRQDEAQIDRHRLLHGKQVERHLVDLALEAVDRNLAADHQVAKGKVAHAVGLNGSLDRLLRHARHDQKPLFQIVEFPMKSNPHHPNLPVM